MVSPGLSDFLELLLVLADLGIEGQVMYGRCPDCWRPINSETVGDLVADLLIHEVRYHPEHAGQEHA